MASSRIFPSSKHNLSSEIMANNGKEYELFVARIQQSILNAENITTQKT